MGSIILHDYNNNYAEVIVPVAVFSGSLAAIGDGVDSQGVSYTVTTSTYRSFHTVNILRSARCMTASAAYQFIGDVLGIDFSECDFSEGDNSAVFNVTYGPGTSSNLAPFVKITKSLESGTLYTVDTSYYHLSEYVGNGGINCHSEYGYVSTGLFAYLYGNEYHFGSISVYPSGPSYNGFRVLVQYSTEIITGNFADVEAEPGEDGFSPTAEHTDPLHPGIGGRGSTNKKHPDYSTDVLTQPGAPDESEASAIGTGFITAYKITQADLGAVGSCLWGTTLEGFIGGLFVNPLDYIVSLSVFPYKPSVGSSTSIKLGRYKCSDTGADGLGFNANGFPLSSQYKTIDFGSVNIPENWGNFLDYTQTTIELYLPFIGCVNIDVSECMRGTINVQYTIDFFTGACVANVLCTKNVPISGIKVKQQYSQHSFQGNCAVQVPLSRTDYGSMVGNLINACTQAITNPVQGFVGMASEAFGGGFRPNVSSKGNIVANAGFCSVLFPYVKLTRPITAEPVAYQEVMGYPSYINNKLNECQGLCICDGINLSNISGATENELNKIRQICMEGVYV